MVVGCKQLWLLLPSDSLRICWRLATDWWHEVTTERIPREASKPLTVSINFWFDIDPSTRRISLPLPPAMQLELARQLEKLILAVLSAAFHTPTFLHAVAQQLKAIISTDALAPQPLLPSSASTTAPSAVMSPGARLWPVLFAFKPHDVDAGRWQALFEFIVWKGSLILTPARLLPMLNDLCEPRRMGVAMPGGASTTQPT